MNQSVFAEVGAEWSSLPHCNALVAVLRCAARPPAVCDSPDALSGLGAARISWLHTRLLAQASAPSAGPNGRSSSRPFTEQL